VDPVVVVNDKGVVYVKTIKGVLPDKDAEVLAE
jgi:hypothetical protein